MAFDLEWHIYKLLGAIDNDIVQAHDLWYDGFDKIYGESFLYSPSVRCYLDVMEKKFPKFTKLVDKEFALMHKPDIDKGDMRSVHLPVTEKSHLLFWLVKDFNVERAYYSECDKDYGSCGSSGSHVVLNLSLKKSLDCDAELKKSQVNGEKFYIDNDILLCRQNAEDIIAAHYAMDEFVRCTYKSEPKKNLRTVHL
jgi:hypothetical protein